MIPMRSPRSSFSFRVVRASHCHLFFGCKPSSYSSSSGFLCTFCILGVPSVYWYTLTMILLLSLCSSELGQNSSSRVVKQVPNDWISGAAKIRPLEAGYFRVTDILNAWRLEFPFIRL
jgi:hypothetical protein